MGEPVRPMDAEIDRILEEDRQLIQEEERRREKSLREAARAEAALRNAKRKIERMLASMR
jgi:hypothetical protein